MFEAKKYIATSKKPASVLVSNDKFNVVVESKRVTIYHSERGCEAVINNHNIRNVEAANIILSTERPQKRCAVNLPCDKGHIEFSAISHDLVMSVFDGKGNRQSQIAIKA